MFCKKEFIQIVKLSTENDTIVKFAENLEFTVPKFDTSGGWNQIQNIKGDFEITSITRKYDDGETYNDAFDKSNNKYFQGLALHHTFYITANIEMEEMCVVNYQLCIPSARLQFLEWGKFIISDFVLPGYDDFKFIYYVKKINGTTKNDIEIFIENPYADVKIQGKQGDFKIQQSSSKDIDLLLSFCFNPSILITDNVADENNEEVATVNAENQALISEPPLEQNEPIQASPIDESRPESVIQTELSTTSSATKLLHKISLNKRFADVFFIASDETKIPSYRIILAECSDIFTRIFEESIELPVQINVEDFDADTIYCAISFLYDKPDAINGKELDVFNFAVKYGIQDLIDTCRSFFEASVDPSNVCDFIQIAYSNNFAELKQKCLKILVEKKKEIDSGKIADLPKNILFDAFCF